MFLTIQFLGVLALSTAVAFLFVILFEAPIVHMEKMLFAVLGVGGGRPIKDRKEDQETKT